MELRSCSSDIVWDQRRALDSDTLEDAVESTKGRSRVPSEFLKQRRSLNIIHRKKKQERDRKIASER
jgi:hypothetical protein